MGEHKRETDGGSGGQDDPPTETSLKKPAQEDYLRPHLPRDVFGSHVGPPAVPVPELADDDDDDDDEPSSAPPTDPDPDPSATQPTEFRTQDLPKPDEATKLAIQQAIAQLQRPKLVLSDDALDDEDEDDADLVEMRPPPTAPYFRTHGATQPEAQGESSTPAAPVPLPRPAAVPLPRSETVEWVPWRPGATEGVDPAIFADEFTRVETAPTRPGAAQPRTTDYLVLHPFPLRAVACVLNFAVVMASPWLASTLLNENVYLPALDVVSEVWFPLAGLAPAGVAVLMALFVTLRRWRHWRYELGYILVAWLAAGGAVAGAVLAVYDDPGLRGLHVLLVWAGLLSLLPLLFSLHVNMDPAWVVGRRRYWTGAVLAFVPLLLTGGLLGGAVSAVHDAHADWRTFMDPQDAEYCDALFDPDGYRPGALAMAVLGQRRDSRLASRSATCVQSLVGAPWSKAQRRSGVPLTKAAVQAIGDTLNKPWRDNQKNQRLADEWTHRRVQLETLHRFMGSLGPAVAQAYRERLRTKGPSRIACDNPFRGPEAALWRAAGHPACGTSLDRVDNVKRAVAWLSFFGQGAAFMDPMINDVRGEKVRDFRPLLQEVSHASSTRETRTHDVTLIAPVDGQLDRQLIVRASPAEEGGQKLYLIAYVPESLKSEVFDIVRDEWGTGSRLRCTLRREYRQQAPRGIYRIYALKNPDDGFLIVRKWTRGGLRREYYQFTLSTTPC